MPPKIPDIDGRSIPQSRGGTLSYRGVDAPNTYSTMGLRAADQSSVGKGLAAVGAGLRDIGDDYAAQMRAEQEKRDKFGLAVAKSKLLQESIRKQTELADDPDFATAEKRYVEHMQKVRAETMPQGISEEAAAYWQLDADDTIFSGSQKIIADSRVKKKSANRAWLDQLENDNLVAVGLARNPEEAQQLMLSTSEAIDGLLAQGDITPEEAVQRRNNFGRAYAKTAFDKRPLNERIEILRDATTYKARDTDTIVDNLILANEGGYVPVDGASGAPAIYGINKKWHEAEYNAAKQITDTQGEEAGKQYARGFYKKNYIEKYGIDQFQPDVQAVLADAVVNHGSSFRDKLIAAAKEGKSAGELLDMRRDEYGRLAQDKDYAPSYKGWMNRLKNVEKFIGRTTGTELDFIAGEPGEIKKMYDDTRNMMVASNLDSDPARVLVDLEAGKYDKDFSPEEIMSYKTKARSAVKGRGDDAEMASIAQNQIEYPEKWERLFSGQLSYEEIQNEVATTGRTPITDYMTNYVTRNIPKQDPYSKAKALEELYKKRADVFTLIKESPIDGFRALKSLQEDVVTKANEGFLSPSQVKDFTQSFSIPLAKSIEKGKLVVPNITAGGLVGDGLGSPSKWAPGVDDPFDIAFDVINDNLKNAPPSQKVAMSEEFIGEMMKLQEAGADVRDPAIIKETMKKIVGRYNLTAKPETALLEKQPNMVVPAPKTEQKAKLKYNPVTGEFE